MSKITDTKMMDEIIKQAFGACPQDVVSPLWEIAEAFGWLEELFKSILEAANAEKPLSGYRICALANVGAHLAFEYSNYSGCHHEEMLGKLKEAGLLN